VGHHQCDPLHCLDSHHDVSTKWVEGWCVYSPTKTKRNFFGGFRISKRKKENKIHGQFLTQILKQTTTRGNFSSFYSVVNSVFCSTMQWNLQMDGKCTRKKTMRPGRYPLILLTCQRFVLVWELIKLVEVSYCKRYGNPNPMNQTTQ
jgi:hypothetical protein